MSEPSTLAQIVADLARGRVLCIGDVMLDRFVYGAVERISPEAPIPVFRVERESIMPGGAGNVARNAVALGGSASLAAVVGDDAPGNDLIALIGGEARVEASLLRERDRATTVKTRYVAGGQQLLRADSETVRPISKETVATLLRVAGEAVGPCDVVVLSDYAKGALTREVVQKLIALAREAGKPVVVDPKGADFSAYEGASVITPNQRELAAAAGSAADGDDAVEHAARRLIESCGIDAMLITRGAAGMSLVPAKGDASHLAAEAREVFDVSGAGDTVIAGFALALGRGAPMIDAARLANLAAGVVVGKVGTSVARGDDLLRAIHAGEWSASEDKIVTLVGAKERVERWRRKGEHVAFTNGCFDLLHPGHVSLLDQAKNACSRLIVGLNSDASVKRLKGEGRPVQGEAARAQVLASLASVDLVVVFEDDTPMALLEALRPDVLVKGADYTLDEVVGRELVEGYGGKVMLARIEPGHSTTNTIARMAR